MDCSPRGSSVRGILQARTWKWVANLFSRESFQPRDKTQSPALQTDPLPSEPSAKPLLISIQFQKWNIWGLVIVITRICFILGHLFPRDAALCQYKTGQVHLESLLPPGELWVPVPDSPSPLAVKSSVQPLSSFLSNQQMLLEKK